MTQVWVATAAIYAAANVRAFNPNDIVPDSVASVLNLEGTGLIERQEVDFDVASYRGIDPVTQAELDALTTGSGRLSVAQLRAAFDAWGGRGATPAYVGARTGSYDAARSVYNFKASNTRRLRASIGAARANTGLCRIAFPGDSLTAGLGNARGTDDPVTLLRQEFARRNYKTGEMIHAWTNGVPEPRFSPAPYAGSATNQFPWPEIISTPTVLTGSGTVLDIVNATASNPMSISVDGGAPVPVPPASGGANLPGVYTLSGLAAGNHSVSISASASSYIYAAGLRETTGVVVENAGISGSTTGDWLENNNNFGPAWSLLHPDGTGQDVVVIELGANDFFTGVPVATMRTNLTTLVERVQTIGADALLVVSNAPQDGDTTWLPYAAAIYDVADARDVPLLDLTDRWGLFPDYNADGLAHDLASDYVHLTAAGNAAKAAAWLDLLGVS